MPEEIPNVPSLESEMKKEKGPSRSPSEELRGLEHLYLWLRAQNFPSPYGKKDLMPHQRHILHWLATTLEYPFPQGSSPYVIEGVEGSEEDARAFVALLSKVLRVFFIPLDIENFQNADCGRDLWVYERIKP